MAVTPSPIIDGCYLDKNSDMFKVRMISYYGKDIKEVVIEDLCGNIRSVDIKNWQNLRLIPCCLAGKNAMTLNAACK